MYLNYCQACGRETEHRFHFTKWQHDIIRCSSCGLGSTVVESEFDPNKIYSHEYFNGNRADGYADYAGSEPVLRSEFRRLLLHLEKHEVHSGKLVEIGSAYGFLMLEAQEKFETVGFEVCADAVAKCRARGLNVESGPVNESSLEAHGPFDVAIMLDVIEHLQNPESVLSMIFRNLKPGGCIAVTTGDWGSLTAKLMGRSWRLMTPPQHLFFFTQTAMVRMLERIGYRILEITHPAKHVPASLILFQLSRLLGLQPKPTKLPNWMSVPVNLFDAMRVVASRPHEHH